MSVSSSNTSSTSLKSASSDLYTASHSLTSQLSNNNPTIPIKILSTAVPQVITTTKTLRRCCGFSLAAVGLIFYCLRGFLNLVLISFHFIGGENAANNGLFLSVESFSCAIGIFQFLRILKMPKLTLKSSNFKNVWVFLLLPLASFSNRFLDGSFVSKWSFYLPFFEGIFFIFYVYGLSLNGRSNSIWSGLKPYRYGTVPLILPIPPSSRAFPQYTIPSNSSSNK